MIHAIVLDGRGRRTTQQFANTGALQSFNAHNKRNGVNLRIGAAAWQDDRPSVNQLERRAKERSLIIGRANGGWMWANKDAVGKAFATRVDALRDAWEQGELGE